MKVFNNEGQTGEVILYLPKKEARQLVDMCEEASDKNKRKSGWKRLSKQMSAEANCF